MVGALVAAFVLVLWYMMLFSPTSSKASKANKATAAANEEAQTLQANIRKVAPVGNGDQKALEAKLEAAIPKSPAEAEFLRQLDTIKAATGVQFQSVAPGPPTPAGGLTSISVNISVKGSVQQVMSYLGRLETLKRLFVTDTLGVTATSAEASAGASTSGGGPVGDVFAGAGAPPALQAQISGRVFTQAVTAVGVSPK
jgi:Tfp pilus assembly protein PilO